LFNERGNASVVTPKEDGIDDMPVVAMKNAFM